MLGKYQNGIELIFHKEEDLDALYTRGEFITAFFPANRKISIKPATGVKNIKLEDSYPITSESGNLLLKYMVHLKT
ncbi:MAG: hypothetical protein IKM28_00340 [Lachnospiraceae bacterium]|nr:hypothetical protein [Lachnospiraceae bacterium]